MVDIVGSDNIGGLNQSGDNDFGDFGFWFQWIEIPTAPSNLTNAGFDTLDGSIGATQTVYNAGGTNDLDNLVSNASNAVLGNDGNNYGVRVVTTLDVTNGGDYTFDVRSDDGMRFYVDGVQVVIDDSLHAPRTRSGTIELDPGQHEIVIIWFERGGQNVLEVDITGPDYPATIQLQNADVQANAAADTVEGGEGDDTVDGGDGADSIAGGADEDSLQGGAGADTIAGGSEADTIDGGADGDTISGDAGADMLQGGAGDDTIDGGAGNDTIDGGDDNDLLTGGEGFDRFVVSAGDDTISDFNTGAGQNFDDDNQANNDFVDLGPYYDSIFEARADLLDDDTLNQSNTEDTKGNTVNYGDNVALPGTIELPGTNADDLTFDNVNLVCFTKGALIRTAKGERPVETLDVGDMIATRDHGLQPIRWIGSRTLPKAALEANVSLRPVILPRRLTGADGRIVVSPQHRMMFSGEMAELLYGAPEVLIKAKDLIGLPGVRVSHPRRVEYWHFALDQHDIVWVNGAASESLLLSDTSIKAIDADGRDELLAIFPELDTGEVFAPVRPILKHAEVAVFFS